MGTKVLSWVIPAIHIRCLTLHFSQPHKSRPEPSAEVLKGKPTLKGEGTRIGRI